MPRSEDTVVVIASGSTLVVLLIARTTSAHGSRKATLSKTATVRIGGNGMAARHPVLRAAAKPAAKLGWRVGRVIVRRKARARTERLRVAGRTIASFAVIYGPMAAEVFGLVEAPKPKRRAPAFAAGVVIGAGAMYVLKRNTRD